MKYILVRNFNNIILKTKNCELVTESNKFKQVLSYDE